jgi:hypothetical protein
MKHIKILMSILIAYSNYYTISYFSMQALANLYFKRKDVRHGNTIKLTRCLIFDPKYVDFYSELNSKLAGKLRDVIDLDDDYSNVRIDRLVTNVILEDGSIATPASSRDFPIVFVSVSTNLHYFIFELTLDLGEANGN